MKPAIAPGTKVRISYIPFPWVHDAPEYIAQYTNKEGTVLKVCKSGLILVKVEGMRNISVAIHYLEVQF